VGTYQQKLDKSRRQKTNNLFLKIMFIKAYGTGAMNVLLSV
jgi:hypothetical protein